MKSLQRWFPSVLVVAAAAGFLFYSLRGLGPRGDGVPAMLAMQTTWHGVTAIHARGTTAVQSASGHRLGRFEFWELSGVGRRAVFAEGKESRTVLITPSEAWTWTDRNPRPVRLADHRANLFPLPDPDADDSFYRFATTWMRIRQAPDGTVGFEGRATGERFIFWLDPKTHLPRRIQIDRTGSADAGRWAVFFEQTELPASLPHSLFEPH